MPKFKVTYTVFQAVSSDVEVVADSEAIAGAKAEQHASLSCDNVQEVRIDEVELICTVPTAPAAQPNALRVIVDFSGGVLEGIRSNVPCEVIVLDSDDEIHQQQAVPGYPSVLSGATGIWAAKRTPSVEPEFVDAAFDGFTDNEPWDPSDNPDNGECD